MAGCASQTVAVHGAPEQAPLVQRHDARVLVHYAGAVRAAEFSNEVVRVPFGAASVEHLDQAFAGMFTSVTQAPEWPPWRSAVPAVDGVLEVDEGNLEVVVGDDARVPDRVSVSYHTCLYGPDGRRLSCWDAQSEALHQRHPVDLFRGGLDPAIGRLVDAAVSDAVALLMRQIEADPVVKDWAVSTRGSATVAGAGARIAFLRWPLPTKRRDAVDEVEGCLQHELGAALPSAEIVGSSRVREALYPLMQASTEPSSEAEFARLLARGDVQARLRELGLGYLVAFAGGTSRGPEEGFVLPAYGPTVGYVWQSEEPRLDAVLWQLKGEPRARSTSAAAHGTNATPVFILPIPIPARTLNEACAELGRNIAEAIKAPTVVQPPAGPEEVLAAPAADSPRTP